MGFISLLKKISRKPSGAISLLLLLLLLLLTLVGPLIWNRDPLAVNLGEALVSPNFQHPFGTDQFGRDILARFLAGARLSLTTGLAVVILGSVIGSFAGLVAGYTGGLVDNTLMRFMDAILAFPPLMFAMAVAIAMGGGGMVSAILGIAIATIPWYARVIRSRVLELRRFEFVEATRSLGGNEFYILTKHILPHVVPLIFIQATLTFGYAVLTVAALSFIGFGARPPTPEWGVMITEGQQYALSGQWWIPIVPGLGLFTAVVAVNLIGDNVRDLLEI